MVDPSSLVVVENGLATGVFNYVLNALGTGAVAVLVILVRRLAYLFIFKNKFIGDWYGYNSTVRDGKEEISKETWTVRRTFLGRLVIDANNYEREEHRYKGRIRIDRKVKHIIVDFVDRRQPDEDHYIPEHFTMRFPAPVVPQNKLTHPLLGFWVGRDMDDRLVAGFVLVSKTKLEPEQVQRYWRVNRRDPNFEFVLPRHQETRAPDAPAPP